MQVLIIEDNTFNAFCLTRLLQVMYTQIDIAVANDSLQALTYLKHTLPTLIILDGDLKAADGLGCNGPALVHTIWSTYINLPIIAWTNSDAMRQAFADVFRQYVKPFNEYNCWNKIVSSERIEQSFSYLIRKELKPVAGQENCNGSLLYAIL